MFIHHPTERVVVIVVVVDGTLSPPTHHPPPRCARISTIVITFTAALVVQRHVIRGDTRGATKGARCMSQQPFLDTEMMKDMRTFILGMGRKGYNIVQLKFFQTNRTFFSTTTQ